MSRTLGKIVAVGAIALLILSANEAFAQDGDTYVIRGATIHTVSSEPVKNGTIILLRTAILFVMQKILRIYCKQKKIIKLQ